MLPRASALLILIGIVTSLASAAPGPVQGGQQAPAPAGAALIIGRVIDGTTGAPVVGVTVTIGGASAPRTGNIVLVDSLGRFIFTGLSAGVFTLVAQKNGYLSGSYGRARPGGQGQSIELHNDERLTDATIRIWRYGSISGRVVDEVGEPVPGANVMAFQRTWVSGRASLGGSGWNGTTDDRGMFRIGRLPPGEYVIGLPSRLVTFPMSFVEADAEARQAGGAPAQTRSAELTAKGSSTLGIFPAYPSARIGDFRIARADGPDTPLPRGNERLTIFPITFHPNAPTTDLATPILLAAGEQRSGVDLQLRLTPTVKISGTVTGPNGPIENLGLRLQLGPESQFWSRMLIEPAQTVSGANGAFTFLGVPPGSFTIAAASTTQGEAISAALPVTVGDKDVVDVSLTLHRHSRVSGRVEFDGASDKPPLRLLSQALRLDPVDGRFERLTFQIEAEGTMLVTVPPGRYFVRLDAGGAASQRGSWTLQSAIVGGRDVSDVPMTVAGGDLDGLVVTLTDHASVLTGTVRDTQNAADLAATVLVFPTDRSLWSDYGGLPRRLRTARTNRTGAFVIPALPAGEYYVIAIPEENTIDWQRQTFLARAAGLATQVKIQDGRNAIVDLTTRRWRP
jgi:hypothetical protein